MLDTHEYNGTDEGDWEDCGLSSEHPGSQTPTRRFGPSSPEDREILAGGPP